MMGKVFLVGAGPGDPGLLTLRAASLIDRADVIVTDALVSPAIRARFPPGARIIEAGKRASAHTLTQSEINELLVSEGRAGNLVVRLKGGDPFVFGRGGEEAEELARAGIPFEMVPGISSALAAPAYAGIPVTHREHATSVTLITGHESDESTGIDWNILAQSRGTLVFLMGLGRLAAIVESLMSHFMPASRSVAVISHGTTPRQRTVTGTLATIVGKVEEAQLQAPALIVVGEVVQLHETISWFEQKPLFGKRVVVTRARDQSSGLRLLLEEEGAEVIEFPTIEIAPPESYASLDAVLEDLSSFSWLIFSSTNGVRSFFERLFVTGGDARRLAGCRIAAVGDTTAAELQQRGVVADLVPEKFQSTALLPLFAKDQSGVRIAVVRAETGRDELIDELRARGGEVHLAVAYRTIASEVRGDELREGLRTSSIDAVTFSSVSTVENFFQRLSTEECDRLFLSARFVSIGPQTSRALRQAGVPEVIEASSASVAALAAAVLTDLSGRPSD